MKFYIIAFFLAYFQSSVLLALFHSMLLTPNLLLLYLFLNILGEGNSWLRRAVLAGFFLDLFQDSLGLNLSGFVLFATLFNLMKLRIEMPSRVSLLLVYALLSLVERLWVIALFRIRYYTELNIWLALLSFSLELLFLYLISGRYLYRES
ncbi:MAG: hypothetical protein ACK42C_06810 [Aquificaceae bacterium]|jgi:hypothetical protein|uniref:hypothetical protein n=1 Tax=Hydrogenobacter sp. Uz 6-8 TaxID=3384828 RepID=UPI000F1A8B6B